MATSQMLAHIHIIAGNVTNAAAVVLTCNSNAMSNVATSNSFQNSENLLVKC